MLTTLVVVISISVVLGVMLGSVTFRITKRRTLDAMQETLRRGWPHPWVGRVVAYSHDPSSPIGEVTRVDGSGKARIKRPSAPVIRRPMIRLVLFDQPT